MLVIADATRRFGSLTVFSDVNFAVSEGSVCALVGANGAGKTTLLRCVVGADDLDSGTITLFGEPVDETAPDFRARMASILDDPGTFPHLSVSEHLQLVAAAHGVADPPSAAERVIEGLGLEHVVDQLPVTLSSGQRRRLALGSAFVRPRDVLVLDEPEQRLDAAGKRWLAQAIEHEKQAGCIVLMASHDPDLVEQVADTCVDGDRWRQ
ncbi:ABC transporter ATP-binding protein [Rhodococcus sp. 06-235-1A]|uniref:ABC transporter ATP-binding protein n=1 Tax=Rhodococcus sp. 06-235-1A TaxID=2022508 RepID=UPI000B9A1C8E|nr:ABC transporter ATP-binding protein [Rhodococcus sp. 06-235-1A]OZD08474.1 ABC transporter ATP-binding protein [Rhodococcus sp. 06-235-1A]